MMSLTENLSYRKKYYALLLAMALASVFVYQVSLRKTILVVKECKVYQLTIQQSVHQQTALSSLQEELNGFDQQIDSYETIHIHQFQQELLSTISDYCSKNKMVIEQFNQPHEALQGNYKIETSIVSIEGHFKKVLELIYHLEKRVLGKKIASIHFEKKKDFKSKREQLITTLYIQNIKQLEE